MLNCQIILFVHLQNFKILEGALQAHVPKYEASRPMESHDTLSMTLFVTAKDEKT